MRERCRVGRNRSEERRKGDVIKVGLAQILRTQTPMTPMDRDSALHGQRELRLGSLRKVSIASFDP